MFSLYTNSPYNLAELEVYHRENRDIVSAEIAITRLDCISQFPKKLPERAIIGLISKAKKSHHYTIGMVTVVSTSSTIMMHSLEDTMQTLGWLAWLICNELLLPGNALATRL